MEEEAYRGLIKGVLSHTNTNTGKCDIHPQQEMMDMLVFKTLVMELLVIGGIIMIVVGVIALVDFLFPDKKIEYVHKL